MYCGTTVDETRDTDNGFFLIFSAPRPRHHPQPQENDVVCNPLSSINGGVRFLLCSLQVSNWSLLSLLSHCVSSFRHQRRVFSSSRCGRRRSFQFLVALPLVTSSRSRRHRPPRLRAFFLLRSTEGACHRPPPTSIFDVWYDDEKNHQRQEGGVRGTRSTPQ